MTAHLAPRTGREPERRPRLRAIGKSSSQVSTVPFVVTLAAILALGMVGMLVLATALQDQAFAVQGKQHEANVLANRVSQLEAQVAEARSMRNLATHAQKLGMRANPYAALVRLSDGKVLGSARLVLGNELADARYLTPQQAAAQAAALDQAEAARTAKRKAAAEAKKQAAQDKKQASAKAKQPPQAAQRAASAGLPQTSRGQR